jgi:hypothetical protein
MKKLLKKVFDPEDLRYWATKARNKYQRLFVRDLEKYLKKRFESRINRPLNLANPQHYNDKVQWLKLYWRDDLAKQCADKWAVRAYVSDVVGEDILNEIYGVFESVKEIPFEKLPMPCVIKGTHGSGYNEFLLKQGDIGRIVKRCARWLKTNYYDRTFEYVYKDMTPRIIVEKYLTDASGRVPKDYKFFCFDGQVRLIQVDLDRFGQHKQNFYDEHFDFVDEQIWCDNDKEHIEQRPINFERMLDIARKLSKPFPHVRVDLYNIDGKIIFGELTFFHLGGLTKFRSESLELQMGRWLDLRKIAEREVV